MKKLFFAFLFVLILFFSCISQRGKILFHPGSAHEGEQTFEDETWIIIESQEGIYIAEWVLMYLDGESGKNKYQKIESMDNFTGKYIFIADNRGDNIQLLNQWAKNVSAIYDFPRLVAQRVEKKLVSAATLYPDDEYGEYFVSLIRRVFDADFSGAVIEESFWVKRQLIFDEEEENIPFVTERYEYLVLISIDKNILQRQIREIMTYVRSNVAVTRDQASAINRVQNNFFEDF